MSYIVRLFAVIVALMTASSAMAAGGWTANEVPTKIEIVRGQGFMIWGPYGDPGGTPLWHEQRRLGS